MSEQALSDTDSILEALNWDYFPRYHEPIRNCLNELASMPLDPQPAIDAAAKCLERIWTGYVDKKTANIFSGFAGVQRALFGLEYEEGSPRRYREHILHMFHVYILGARLLSPLATAPEPTRDQLLKDVVKVVPEPAEIANWPGWNPYDSPKRLFYLWTLMSTFHDIGIPVERLANMRDGLNRYLDYFGRDLAELLTHLEPAVTSQLQYYFGLMGRLFNSRIKLDDKHPGQYDAGPDIHPYLYKTLADAMGGDEPDHGVISALCLYRSIERAFMQDRSEHDLSLNHFPKYVDLVLEQDMTRAALAIAFHNLNPQEYPKLFPIDFAEFPLTFLLLVCDELQEFYRLEGVTPRGLVPLPRLPVVQAEYSHPRLAAEIDYHYSHPTDENWAAMKQNANAFTTEIGVPPYQTHSELVSGLWKRAIDNLVRKLRFGPDSQLHCRVRVLYKEQSGLDRELGNFDSDDAPTT